MSNMLLRCMRWASKEVLVTAFKTYVYPILEYASPVWSPHMAKDIDKVENVLRRFTRKVYSRSGLQPASYSDRLSYLGLKSLELRRIHIDVCLAHKIIHRASPLAMDDYFQISPYVGTRAGAIKLYRPTSRLDIRKNSFASRVVPLWNHLLGGGKNKDITALVSPVGFKLALENVDFSKFMKFDRHL